MNPRRAVEHRTEVVAASFLGLTGVQTRSNPDHRLVPRLIGEAELGSESVSGETASVTDANAAADASPAVET